MRLLPAVLVQLLAATPGAADGVMLVDGRPFLMGSDRDVPGEAPQHGFYLGQHRGTARGHHFVGFRCATSEDLGGR